MMTVCKVRIFLLLLTMSGLLLGPATARSLNRTNEETKTTSSQNKAYNATAKDKMDNLDSLRGIFRKSSLLRVFERLLLSSHMTPTLNEYSDSSFTVFMPWDKAMEKLPFGWLARLEQPMWALHLKRFVLHHIHKGGLSLDLLQQTPSVTMMDGENIQITTNRVRPRVDDVDYLAYTTKSDIRAFMMDEILVPSFMERTAIMVVPTSLASRWIKYAYKAGLEKLLDDPARVVTVLVPSDEAFDRVDEETIALWESPAGKESLRQVLLRHIVPGTVIASDTMQQGSVTVEESLVNDAPVIFQKNFEFLQVNAALVIQEDIVASNGLVHIIDRVILPSDNEMQIQMDGSTQPIVQ